MTNLVCREISGCDFEQALTARASLALPYRQPRLSAPSRPFKPQPAEQKAEDINSELEMEARADRERARILAGLLAHSSRNREERSSDRQALVALGLSAVDAILAGLSRFGRLDIIDESAVVLAQVMRLPGVDARLLTALKKGSEAERIAVVDAIGNHDDALPWQRNALECALQDRAPDVRDRAAQALFNIAGSESIELLQVALQAEDHPIVRETMVDILGELCR